MAAVKTVKIKEVNNRLLLTNQTQPDVENEYSHTKAFFLFISGLEIGQKTLPCPFESTWNMSEVFYIDELLFPFSTYFPGFAVLSSDLNVLNDVKLLSGTQEAFVVHTAGLSCRFTLDLLCAM